MDDTSLYDCIEEINIDIQNLRSIRRHAERRFEEVQKWMTPDSKEKQLQKCVTSDFIGFKNKQLKEWDELLTKLDVSIENLIQTKKIIQQKLLDGQK